MLYKIESLPADIATAQLWQFSYGTKDDRTYDWTDAKAVLIAPLTDKRDHQRLLVLPGGLMKWRTDVCKANAKAIRNRLVANGLVSETDASPRELLQPIIFTSPGLACNVLYGGSINGWDEWKLVERHFQTKRSLSDAWAESGRDEFELHLYTQPPDVIEFG